jgi:transposase
MTRAWVGIDIAKLKFDVAITFEDKRKFHKVFENHSKGFTEFAKWLATFNLKDPHFCLEATGIYGYELAYFLHEKSYRLSVVNPARIKAHAASEGIRNKTDKVDAYVISRFCKAHDPKAWTPPSANLHELQGLYRCLQSLQEDLTRVNNRLEGCHTRSKEIKKIWEDCLKDLEAKITKVEKQIQTLITEDHDLNEQVELLESIPGIGNKTAVAILSELPNIKNFKNAKEIGAFAGLSSKRKESGTSVRGRGSLCKRGSSALRKALFFPAMVAKKYNPILKGFSERLVKKGKNGKVIIAAVMRKLLHIIYGVLKNRQVFTTS